MEESSYFVGFRQVRPSPPGAWVIMGPYRTNEEAKREREKAKAWDAEVTVPFAAKDAAAAAKHSFVQND